MKVPKMAIYTLGPYTILGTGETTNPKYPDNLGSPKQPPEDPKKPEGQSDPDDPDDSDNDHYLPFDDTEDRLEAEDFTVPQDPEG